MSVTYETEPMSQIQHALATSNQPRLRQLVAVEADDTVHVYASGDPFLWKPEDHVYEYRGHACEVVRDEHGKWYISHVGWMNGGLSLAPLDWHDGLDRESSSLDD